MKTITKTKIARTSIYLFVLVTFWFIMLLHQAFVQKNTRNMWITGGVGFAFVLFNKAQDVFMVEEKIVEEKRTIEEEE